MSVVVPASDNRPGKLQDLLAAARAGDQEQLGQLLQLYRNYLIVLASAQLDANLRRRLSPSDVVQEAMLGACRDFAQFRGSTERELLGWLRQVLIHRLHAIYQTHKQAGMRDVRREISMEQLGAAVEESTAGFSRILADPGPSPSAPIHQREHTVAIANQLAKLRPDYRDVIVLRNLQGLSFEEVAQRMERKPGAVRMLWLRAIERFRQVYQENE